MTKLVRTRTLPLRASGQLRNIGLGADQNHTYDAAGNVTTSGTRTFAYNTWGHIAAAKKGPTNRAIYRYNVFIQRISKVAGSVTSYYVNDDSGLALGEYNSGGTPAK